MNRWPTPPRASLRRAALWGLLPLGLAGGFAGGRALRQPPMQPEPLPPALAGAVERCHLSLGDVAFYRGGPKDGTPLLLIHGVHAAASAYEVKPIYDHYGKMRPVYALDLPGFGLSDRPDRIYTPALMGAAILAVVDEIRRRHGPYPVDALAIAAASEFLGQAAGDHPTLFRTVAFVGPIRAGAAERPHAEAGSVSGRVSLYDALSFPLWRRRLFAALASRASLRLALVRAWGSTKIDEGLLDYYSISARQPGAEHAPLSSIAGFLGSADTAQIYRSVVAPVWLARGRRGADRALAVESHATWTTRVFDTGAMPHFEQTEAFVESYDAFLAGAV